MKDWILNLKFSYIKSKNHIIGRPEFFLQTIYIINRNTATASNSNLWFSYDIILLINPEFGKYEICLITTWKDSDNFWINPSDIFNACVNCRITFTLTEYLRDICKSLFLKNDNSFGNNSELIPLIAIDRGLNRKYSNQRNIRFDCSVNILILYEIYFRN